MSAAETAFQQYNTSLETIAKVGEVIALIFVLTVAIGIIGLVLFILWRQGTRADSRLSKEQQNSDRLAQALNNLSDGLKSQQTVSQQQVTTLTTITDSLKTLTNLTTFGNTKLSDVSTQVTNVSDKLDKLISQGDETLKALDELRSSPTEEHAALRLSIKELIELVKKEKKQTSETQAVSLPLTPILPITVSAVSTTPVVEVKAVGEPIPT